jgi:UDP-2,4-diacetamido-2,4,6-trideoxy-beta-L-altropyranose hydrolase
MNVFILTEGGENIGLGHITRCTSIYQAFEKAGIESQLIVNGDQTVRDLLRDKNCKVFNWLNDRKILLATVKNADIVFIDSYLAGCDLYEKIANVVKTAVYIDDDIRINYPKGFVLNGAIHAEQMPYPKIKEVNYLLGARYAPLRKEFWDVPAKPIRDNLGTVMITFGGADIHNLTPKVLKWLTDACPEMFKKVIIAKSFQNTAEIERLKDSNTELIYYPNAAEMKKVMLESDIAISAGGQTLYELARIGVPTIGICIAENQLHNIEGWRNSGFLKYVGWYSDENLEQRLKSSLRYLANKRIRMHTSEIGRKVIDGQGYKHIINAINTK